MHGGQHKLSAVFFCAYFLSVKPSVLKRNTNVMCFVMQNVKILIAVSIFEPYYWAVLRKRQCYLTGELIYETAERAGLLLAL